MQLGCRELPWTPVVGRRAASGLLWLEQVAGGRAVQKFLGGKIRGTPFSGQYLCGIVGIVAGRRVIGDLLDLLRLGRTPLCDINSYYAAGKRWPLGMRVQDGQLIDVLPASEPQKSLPPTTAEHK